MAIVQFEGYCNACRKNHIEYRELSNEERREGSTITWKCECGAEHTTELARHYIIVSITKNMEEFNNSGIPEKIHDYDDAQAALFELPELTGTEKQLKWGYAIRKKSMSNFYGYMRIHRIPLKKSILGLIQELPTDAHWWIENSNGTWEWVKEEVIYNKLLEIKKARKTQE